MEADDRPENPDRLASRRNPGETIKESSLKRRRRKRTKPKKNAITKASLNATDATAQARIEKLKSKEAKPSKYVSTLLETASELRHVLGSLFLKYRYVFEESERNQVRDVIERSKRAIVDVPRPGRPAGTRVAPKLSDEQMSKLIEQHRAGVPVTTLALRFKLSRPTVTKYLQEFGDDVPKSPENPVE